MKSEMDTPETRKVELAESLNKPEERPPARLLGVLAP